jgi:uncharacterized damage-inducible protein DinB
MCARTWTTNCVAQQHDQGLNTVDSSLQTLLDYKAWGDQELMAFVCEQHSSAPPELLHKALRLMNHIHVVDCIFAAHLAGQAHPYSSTNTEDTPTPEELLWRMQETNAQLQTLAQNLQPQQALQRIHFAFTDGDGGGMSPFEMLLHVCVHSTYHRGQVGQMFKDAGIAPPRELLTRKLHTQEPGRRHPC